MSSIQPTNSSFDQTQQIQQNQSSTPIESSIRPIVDPNTNSESNASFSTYSAFAKEHPKLHKATMMSIANSMMQDLKSSSERMKKTLQEAQQG
jgi:hypothetical protein